jgi:copper chaperone CopZ
MRNTLIILSLLAATGTAAAETLKATVNGMVCAFCAQGIEKRLTALDATAAVYVDLKHRVVAVETKPGQTLDEKKLTTEIVEAGYAVEKVERVPQTVEQIRGQTQGAR